MLVVGAGPGLHCSPEGADPAEGLEMHGSQPRRAIASLGAAVCLTLTVRLPVVRRASR